MALSLASITPQVATVIPAKRQVAGAADRGPNLFTQPDPEHGAPEGWLALSYDTDQWYDVPCDGEWVEDTVKKGDKKGQPITRLTGDAQEVVRQLREAADDLGIGVAIKYDHEVYAKGAKKGEPVPGRVVVKYLGQQRKQKKSTTTEASAE